MSPRITKQEQEDQVALAAEDDGDYVKLEIKSEKSTIPSFSSRIDAPAPPARASFQSLSSTKGNSFKPAKNDSLKEHNLKMKINQLQTKLKTAKNTEYRTSDYIDTLKAEIERIKESRLDATKAKEEMKDLKAVIRDLNAGNKGVRAVSGGVKAVKEGVKAGSKDLVTQLNEENRNLKAANKDLAAQLKVSKEMALRPLADPIMGKVKVEEGEEKMED